MSVTDNSNKREKDDFWAIEKLIPKQEKKRYSRPATATSAVEITVGQPLSDNNPQTGLTLPYTPHRASPPEPSRPEPTPLDEYSPVCPLISKVKIFRWKINYNYYEEFRCDALRYRDAFAHECRPVPYFSYMPQYVQLSKDQLSWYVFWRDKARHGEFLPTDYSYIMLLVYEIINLGGDGDTLAGQKLLCELHSHYRTEYPRLDRYLSDWICDYSLVHKLSPPSDCSPELMNNSQLREFYVYSEESDASDFYARLLIRYCSNYDYHKSKFAIGENLATYDRCIPAALSRVIERCSGSGQLLSGVGLENNTLIRDVYVGALCASEVKRRLEIEYCSFSRSHELRFLIADIIKYSENRIRLWLGIKSRLSVYGLPKTVTETLDAYFSEALPVVRSSPREAEQPVAEYDRLYDIPRSDLSLENADRIEENSWDTTELLVNAFDAPEAEVKAVEAPIEAAIPVCTAPQDEPGNSDFASELKARIGEKYAFVEAAKQHDFNRQHMLANRFSVLLDALADEINDNAADILGDIILEEAEGGYTIIDEYMEII